MSSSSASSSSVVISSSSSFSFFKVYQRCQLRLCKTCTDSFYFQFFFDQELVLVQTTELVDLVLVFAANLDFIAHCLFIFPRQLMQIVSGESLKAAGLCTIRLFILGAQPVDLQGYWFNSID